MRIAGLISAAQNATSYRVQRASFMMTPRLYNAVAIYFSDATLASAFVARWVVESCPDTRRRLIWAVFSAAGNLPLRTPGTWRTISGTQADRKSVGRAPVNTWRCKLNRNSKSYGVEPVSALPRHRFRMRILRLSSGVHAHSG